MNPQLSYRDSREERTGNRAEAEAADFQLAERVADSKDQEECDLGMRAENGAEVLNHDAGCEA